VQVASYRRCEAATGALDTSTGSGQGKSQGIESDSNDVAATHIFCQGFQVKIPNMISSAAARLNTYKLTGFEDSEANWRVEGRV
jgi:hypothetical protein